MKKQINLTEKDLFPLISTQEMIDNNKGIKVIINAKEGYITGYNKTGFIILLIDGNIINDIGPEEIKPILKTIDQITDEERIEYKQLLKNIKSVNKYNIPLLNGIKSNWYIKKEFDIFQWIDQDLAIKFKT